MKLEKDKEKVKINIWILKEWKDAFEKLARNRSYKEGKNYNYHDLVREAFVAYLSLQDKSD